MADPMICLIDADNLLSIENPLIAIIEGAPLNVRKIGEETWSI